jgi:hypothetical protein
MDKLRSTEASPASNHVSTPPSPHHNASTDGTPEDDADASPPAVEDSENQLVVRAGRSLKNMLVDLMAVLETQAKTRIFIQGDITLRVEGRDTYTVSLFNAEDIEPADLKVRINKVTNSGPEFPIGQSNRTVAATTELPYTRKRAHDESDHIDLSDLASGTSKRARVDSGEDEIGHSTPEATRRNGKGKTQSERESSEPAPTVVSRLQNVSAQIKWVEECRRIAEEGHDRREETWRTTSATFHDEMRKARERHEAWMVSEMAWQRNLLVGMANDLKGLYPLGHSLKWGT